MQTRPASILAIAGVALMSLAVQAEEAAFDPVAAAQRLLSLPHAERVAFARSHAPAQQLAVIRALSPEQLCDIGAVAATALGTYRARLVKEERIDGKLKPAQTIELVLRDEPKALLATFVEGPAKGRRMLYSARLRKDELRVREAGLFSIAGALWLGLDSGLTRKDTNHRATSLGLGPLVKLLRDDMDRARPFGGYRGISGRLDAQGRSCVTFEAPRDAKDLYGQTAHLCIDTTLLLPVEAEIHDRKGLLERYRWQDVRPNQSVDESVFTLEGADL